MHNKFPKPTFSTRRKNELPRIHFDISFIHRRLYHHFPHSTKLLAFVGRQIFRSNPVRNIHLKPVYDTLHTPTLLPRANTWKKSERNIFSHYDTVLPKFKSFSTPASSFTSNKNQTNNVNFSNHSCIPQALQKRGVSSSKLAIFEPSDERASAIRRLTFF